MQLIGLTGGTGSGKSAAAKRFQARGIPVIDADAVGHALIAPGGDLEPAVIEAFGSGIATDGHVDRKKLGALVFHDASKRAQLNAMIHPAIRDAVARQCKAYAEEGHTTVVLDAALLAEQGERDAYLSGLILVLASRNVRLARLVEHRGMDASAAQMQIDAQTPPGKKRAVADWIVHNEGDIEDLHRQVDDIADDLSRRYG